MKKENEERKCEMGEIWIDQVKPEPNQPRKEFDEEELKALAEGIKRQGLINPIEIDENNIIVDGERRWRACKMAGITKIPYKRKVLKGELKKDSNFKLKRQLQANLTGRNLKIAEAKEAIERITPHIVADMRKGKHSENSLLKLSKEIGVSQSYLSEILGIARRGSKELIKAVENKDIPSSTAIEISKIENPEVQNQVLEYAEEQEAPRDEIRDLVKEVKDKTPEVAEEIIETHEAIEPIAQETADMITKAFEKEAKENPHFNQSLKERSPEIANLFMLRVVAGLSNKGEVFCPKHHQSKLVWACCHEDVEDTIATLQKKYEKGEKDASKKKRK